MPQKCERPGILNAFTPHILPTLIPFNGTKCFLIKGKGFFHLPERVGGARRPVILNQLIKNLSYPLLCHFIVVKKPPRKEQGGSTNQLNQTYENKTPT